MVKTVVARFVFESNRTCAYPVPSMVMISHQNSIVEESIPVVPSPTVGVIFSGGGKESRPEGLGFASFQDVVLALSFKVSSNISRMDSFPSRVTMFQVYATMSLQKGGNCFCVFPSGRGPTYSSSGSSTNKSMALWILLPESASEKFRIHSSAMVVAVVNCEMLSPSPPIEAARRVAEVAAAADVFIHDGSEFGCIVFVSITTRPGATITKAVER